MTELALHILDLAQNSTRARADAICVRVHASRAQNRLTISIEDNGCGMDAQMVARVASPFVTTRTTRKVGLGIPMFMQTARQAGGDLSIQSAPGKGTTLTAWFALNHLDRPPLGDLAGTLLALVLMEPALRWTLDVRTDAAAFEFDTMEIRQTLGADIALTHPEVTDWMRGFLQEGIDGVLGGEQV